MVTLSCSLLFALACDSGNPVAPETEPPAGGAATTTYVVTLSADPQTLEVGTSDRSVVTVMVSQTADQMPPPDGTEVVVNTDLGNFGTDAQGNPILLQTLALTGGQVQVTFFPGEEVGSATLLAQVGDSIGSLAMSLVETAFFVEAVQPNVGLPEGGTTVTIQGGGFREPLQVRFASVLATVVDVPSSQIIVVQTPASVAEVAPGGSLAVDVSVTTSLDRPEPRTATLAAAFSYAEDAPPPLFITAVEPASGGAEGGETVRVSGGGFRAPLRVEFGGAAGRDIVLVSEEELEVTTPASPTPAEVTAVDVTVVSALDEEAPASATLPGAYTFVPDLPPPLFLLEVEPNVGGPTGGEVVTITGQGFQDPLRVEFGDKVGESPTVVTSRELTVIVPSPQAALGAGEIVTVDVKVTTFTDGAASQEATLPGGYTYSAAGLDPLFVLAVDPNVGAPSGGERVTITGEGFREPLRVDFGGKAGSDPQFVSSTEINVLTPSSPQPVAAGEPLAVDVDVTLFLDSGATQTATLPGGFTYSAGPLAAPPQVFSVSPSSGPNSGGTVVTILGQDFEDPVEVRFGGVEATAVTFVSSSELTAETPPATGIGQGNQNMSVDVTVKNRSTGLEGTLAGGFTYASPIVITALDPASGSFEGGETVKVSGTGFVDPFILELGGVRQTGEAFVSETEVEFTTVGVSVSECPDGGELPQMGVVITDTTTGASGSADLVFTYTVPMPRIFTIAPTAGPQLGNTIVTIRGEDFAEPVRVVFVAADQEFAATVQGAITDIQIRVTSPRLDNTAFPEEDCVVGESQGKRYLPVAVDVKVIHQSTTCSDTLPNAFTYNPTDSSCRLGG